MPDRIRSSIVYLVNTLDVCPLLEYLLQNDVLDVEEYEAAVAKEGDKLDLSKYVVRRMLKKSTEQVDAFLEVVERHQLDVVKHVAKTMEDRRATVATNSAGAGSTTTASAKPEKVKSPSSASSSASSGQYKKQQVTGNSAGQHNTTSDTKNVQSNITASPTQSQPTSQETQTLDSATQHTNKLLPDKDVHFTGRQDIVTTVAQTVLTPTHKALDNVKVQSLVAPAGFGKTSVAIAVGHMCREAGVRVEFFDLRGVADVSTVQSMVRARLDDSSTSTPTHPIRKKETSSEGGNSPMLVILDNAEDAIQSAVGKDFQLQDVVKWIVGLQRNAHILLTSRVLLGAHVAQFKLEQHRLDCLPEHSAVLLLQSLCTKGSVRSKTARQLVHHCGCVPLAVRIAAGMLQGGLYNANMLLATFRKMGLDVFRDDDLKPNHQIMRLLELAYNMLQPEDKNTFHALSHIPTSFSSDAACAMVGLTGNDKTMIHLLRFYPLIKICFLEFNAMTDRYSLQPFIAQLGRYSCPEYRRPEYGRRLCNHYLGLLVTGKFSKRGCSPEQAMVLTAQLQQELPNIQRAARLSVDVLTDRDFGANGALMTSTTTLLLVHFGNRFFERMALLKEIPYYQRGSAVGHFLEDRVMVCGNTEALQHIVAILDQLSPKDHGDTCEESEKSIVCTAIAIQSAKAMCSVLLDCRKGAEKLGSESIAELEEACRMVNDAREKVQLSDEEDFMLQAMELTFSTLLGKSLCDSKSIEDLYRRKITDIYLKGNESSLSNASVADTLAQLQELRLASAVQWNLSPFMLKKLDTRNSIEKYQPLSRNIEVQLAFYLQQHFVTPHVDDSWIIELLRQPVSLSWDHPALLRFCTNYPTPFCLVSSAQSYRSIAYSYIRRHCNGSRSNGESEARNFGLLETSTVQCCLRYAKLHLHRSNQVPEGVYSTDFLAGANSLVKECIGHLPTNSAHGVSVSGIVYIPATYEQAVTATLFALHQQSKKGDVTVEHHIELLEWCGVAAACFVCHNLDTVEACTHCGMTWLCAKHKIDKYQSEHAGQHCAMLRVLQQRLQR